MRWLLGLFVIAAAGALLWLSRSDEIERAARPDVRITHPDTPGATPETPEGVLPVEDGVAVAPEEETDPAQHIWIGRAWSVGNRAPANDASVALEDIETAQVWAQPPAAATGAFFAKTPPFALLSKRLRLVLENADAEIAVIPVTLGKDGFTDLGKVRLRGRGKIHGRVEPPHRPVSLTVRRFGELTLLPGVLASGRSDKHGNFELRGIPHGMYAVEGRDADGRIYLAAPVVVPEGPPLVLRALPSAPLAVTVRNTLGEPMAAARIEALPLDARPENEPLSPLVLVRSRFAVTNADGRAWFPHLLPGRYLLYVTAAGTDYEFKHAHSKRAQRLLHVPVDPTVVLRCVEAPPKPARPPKISIPVPNVNVEVRVEGRSTLPARNVSRTFHRKTDADGRITIPRVGTLEMTATVIARTVMRQGKVIYRYPKAPTPFITPVGLRPAQFKDDAPEPERTGPARTVRVVTPAGVPVKGARVYAEGNPHRKTNAKGTATVGAVVNEKEGRIYRPRLASGDPGDVFGAREEIELIWHRGVRIALRLRDHADGFPIAHDVSIRPRPSAWRMTTPGVFVAWWTPGRARRLRVTAPGYAAWEGAPPDEGEEIDVALQAATSLMARLELEAVANNGPAPGLWVHGQFDGDWRPFEGYTEFHALTGRAGKVAVDELAQGPWQIRVEGERRHAATKVTLGAARNPLNIHVDQPSKHRGVVVDDRGRAVAGARVAADGLPHVRTDGRGIFFLRKRPDRLVVTAPGHAGQTVETEGLFKKGPTRVVLQRLGGIALPLVGPAPDFLEMSMTLSWQSARGVTTWTTLDRTARVVRGRLRADGIPPGAVSLNPVRGSVWAEPVIVHVRPGATTATPKIKIRRGGAIEGKITDGARPLAGRFVYANTRVARSDAQGAFRFVGLPAGRYRVWTRDQQPANAQQNRALRVGATSHVRVALLVVR